MECTMVTRKSILWRTWGWLDDRYQLTSLLGALLHVEIPRTARTYYLGGITLFFFVVQATTGILLSLYYQPTPDAAPGSILFIMNQVNFGWLIRSIHSWSATCMVLFCILHLLRVFIQGAYKPPHQMTWVMGTLLLMLTLAFGFTGYLLPWDQRAFWATTVGTEIAGAVPFIGEWLLAFLRGGADVTAHTLTRFYGTHMLVLPASLGAALVIHLVFVHQQGLADPARPTGGRGEAPVGAAASQPKRRLLPFFPNYMLDEFIAWYLMLAALIVLASIYPAGLEAPADPLHTPEHIKPEWYFLFLYQGLKLVPRTVGVLAPFVGGLILLVFPFFDRNPHAFPRRRPIAMLVAALILIAVVGLSVWGSSS